MDENEIKSTGGDETQASENLIRSTKQKEWKNYKLKYNVPLNSLNMKDIIAIFNNKKSIVEYVVIHKNNIYIFLNKSMYIFIFIFIMYISFF